MNMKKYRITKYNPEYRDEYEHYDEMRVRHA